MFNNLFGNVNLFEKGLDASWLRNKVIANNIANVDTPGFKASTVNFESELKRALQEGNGSSAVGKVKPTVVADTTSSYNANGNNVDIDHENVEMAKNTIYYNELVEQISSEFSRLNTAIKG